MALPLAAWLASCALAAASEPQPALSPVALPPVGSAPCIACRGPELDPRTAFTPDDWKALQGGGALVATPERQESEHDLMARSTGTSLVQRPPSEVWTVLTDFEHWPKFMPLLRETRVEKREGARAWVAQKFRVWFYPMRHTTVYQLDPGDGRLAWQLDPEEPHDLESSEGHWELVALDGGAATLVKYEARISAGRAVPGFLERMLRERSLGQMLQALRGEVLRRFPKG